MATPTLPPDFKEFLKSLNANKVEYLLVGGYAVGYHGYVRATADIDVWVARSPENALRLVEALRQFGMDDPGLTAELFLKEKMIVRMGVPPLRIEILTSASGVTFEECYRARIDVSIDDVPVSLISLVDLRTNKSASGRLKDLADLEHLP